MFRPFSTFLPLGDIISMSSEFVGNWILHPARWILARQMRLCGAFGTYRTSLSLITFVASPMREEILTVPRPDCAANATPMTPGTG